jgi:hypothetical protein
LVRREIRQDISERESKRERGRRRRRREGERVGKADYFFTHLQIDQNLKKPANKSFFNGKKLAKK